MKNKFLYHTLIVGGFNLLADTIEIAVYSPWLLSEDVLIPPFLKVARLFFEFYKDKGYDSINLKVSLIRVA